MQSSIEQIAALYEHIGEGNSLSAIGKALAKLLDADSVGIWLAHDEIITSLFATEAVQESVEPYQLYYQKLDVWSSNPAPLNTVSLGLESFDESRLVTTEFFNDFAKHYGMLRPLGGTLSLGRGVHATISTNRASRHRLFGEEEKSLLQNLVPYLRGALALQFNFGIEGGSLQASRDGLDAIAHPVIICDGFGRVEFANAAGQQLASQQEFLTFGGPIGILRTASAADNERLYWAIHRVTQGDPSSVWLESMRGERLQLLLTPLRPNHRGGAARVMISAGLNRHTTSLTPGQLQRMFGLSPAQAALCLLLSSGMTLEEAALKRNIATTTARTHYAAILQKTGTTNLRGLLTLLARLPVTRSL